LVSKIQGKELIFDSHELFSEVPELQHRQFVKSVWLGMENYLMPKLKKVITVSDSIKSYYEKRYGILVTVVRNLPEPKAVKTNKFPFSTHGKKVLLYQGSVNMGRGLELMIQTMKHLEDYLLVIIGSGDIMEQLEQNVLQNNLENKVKFMGKVSPKELHKLTPNASIGLSLEEDLGLNYRYALPNKIFDYIQAEVPVIVSALPEMEKLVTSVQAGTILRQRSPEDLAKLIQNFSPEMYTDALKKAKRELVWTKEKIALEKLVKA
jgi:glycosyltransferase involved in cell wall biosynthesis